MVDESALEIPFLFFELRALLVGILWRKMKRGRKGGD